MGRAHQCPRRYLRYDPFLRGQSSPVFRVSAPWFTAMAWRRGAMFRSSGSWRECTYLSWFNCDTRQIRISSFSYSSCKASVVASTRKKTLSGRFSWHSYCWVNLSVVTSLTWRRPKSFSKSTSAPLSIKVFWQIKHFQRDMGIATKLLSIVPHSHQSAFQVLDCCFLRCSISFSNASWLRRSKLAALS